LIINVSSYEFRMRSLLQGNLIALINLKQKMV